jgi:thioredoxin-related protein
MKYLVVTLLSGFLLYSSTWETDLEKAKQKAQSEHKLILLNFSGSDWCGPCIRMHKEIFENDSFTQYADDHLVLINADFPRSKKHKLSEDQQKKNDQMADKYNKEGIFPLTLLMTADGKILKRWEGFPQISPDSFTSQIKSFADANQ